ncbi:dedicator of cytokinesis protein 3-like isoform X2, partial [Dinothrombium tinctorium]
LFNFESTNIHCLNLEIGETVQILEECGDWFRGFSTKNRSKRGIFPANFIALKPFKLENEGLFENVTPLEDPVSREVVKCLREWQFIWRNELYIKRRVELFERIHSTMTDLIEMRKQLITGTLTVDQIKELRLRITTKIDWGNRQLGLDLVPRIEGNIVDPDLISPLQLFHIHCESSEGPDSSSRHSNNSNHSSTVALCANFYYLHIRDVCLAISNIDDTFLLSFSLYNYSTNSCISERFVAQINGSHCDVQKLNLSTVFTDLGSEDMSRDLYLLIQVFRHGKMLISDSKSSSKYSSSSLPSSLTLNASNSSGFRYKRPYGSAILSLAELKPDSCEQDYTIKLFSSNNESDFYQIHEMLLRKQTNKLTQIQSSSITLTLRQLSGLDADKVILENPLIFKNVTCLTGKRGFPEIIMPGNVRNDLYFNLEVGEFEKGGKSIPKNIEATVTLYGSDGIPIKNSISFGAGVEPVTHYTSVVLYHNNNPRWMELLKILIPLEVFDVNAHIRLEFRHCSTKESSNHQKEKKFLGFSFIPLSDEQGTIIKDGFHEVYIYKCTDVIEARNKLSDPVSYLTLPFGPKDERTNLRTSSPFLTKSAKESVHIRTLLCSTKLTQNGDLLALLKWRANPDTVSEALKKVLRLNGEEIVKFLQDILDALFSMFSTHDGNTTHYTGLVFKALIHIFCLLEDPKYEHFKPVLDTYIEGHFAAALVYKGLLHCVKQCADFIKEPEVQDKIQQCFRSLKWIFKFIVQSRILFARATGDSNEELFRQDLFSLFSSFNRMLSINHELHLVPSQVKLIDNFSTIYDQLLRVLTPIDLVRIIKMTINCLPYSDPCNQLIRAKLRCIHETMKNEMLLRDSEARRELIDVFGRHLKEHINRQQELKLCSMITSDILMFLHNEKMSIASGVSPGTGTISNVSRDVEVLVLCLLEPFVSVIIELSANLNTNPETIKYVHSFIFSLTTLLRLMDDFHFAQLLSVKSRREKRDLLLQVFYVFKTMFEPTLFPPDWMVVRMTNNHIILCSLQEFSSLLTTDFLGGPNGSFDEKLWSSYFSLSVSFLTQSALQLETFSETKRESILDKYGDMRVLMGFQILSMWEQLGEYKIHFIPSMVAPFLEVTLVPEKELRKATLPIFYDMIDAEYKSDGNFKQVESKLIDKLDILVSENKGDDDFRQLFNTILLDKVKLENPVWKEQGIQMIHSITKLLELLLDYRYAMNGEENRDKRMSCTVNLLKFYKNEINRKEMYIRYIYKLYDLHLPADNFTEAAFTLKLHSQLLDWSSNIVAGDSYSGREQMEWQRKESLYLFIIDNFDKGKCWEEGIPLIKELSEFYETKLFDYYKLSSLLKTQARFLDNILTQLRPEPEYFRVGFYGMGFPMFLRNKVFVYRGVEYEKMPAFIARIQNEFPQAQIMTKNSPPDENILSSNAQFIQVCSVRPVPDLRPQFHGHEVPEKVLSYYLVNDVKTFVFDRPVHKGIVDKDNEFKSLWIERTTLITDEKLPGILRWSEVVEKSVTELSPVEHACETIENMIRELQKLITSYTADAMKPISPLSMRLQGVIEAAVNGGVAKYQDAFFNPKFIHSHPEHMSHVRRLKQLLLQKLRILEGGLSLHGRLAPASVQPLHKRLVERFTLMRHSLLEASAYVFDYRLDSIVSRRPSIVNMPLPPIPPDANPYSAPHRENHLSCVVETNGIHNEDEIYSVPQDCFLNMTPPIPERNSPAPAPPLPPSRPRSAGYVSIDNHCSPPVPTCKPPPIPSQYNGLIQRSRSIPRSQNMSQYQQHQHLLQHQHSLPNYYSMSPTKENSFPGPVPPLPPRNSNTLERQRRNYTPPTDNTDDERPALPKRTLKKSVAKDPSSFVVPIDFESSNVDIPPPLPSKRCAIAEPSEIVEELGAPLENVDSNNVNTDEISLKSASSVSTISISEGTSSASSVENNAACVSQTITSVIDEDDNTAIV